MIDNVKHFERILISALPNEEALTLDEIIKWTNIKYIGISDVDVYIFTNKKFVEKIINKNLNKIKQAIKDIDNKSVRSIYLNGEKQNFELKELDSKRTIDTINMDTIKSERTQEISGENDIIQETFKYDSSILNKKQVSLIFHNKELNETKRIRIKTNILNNKIYFIRRNKLKKNLSELLSLRFVPNTNDTQEVIKIFKL